MFLQKSMVLWIALCLGSLALYAQTDKVQQGVLFKKGTTIRIAHADIYDVRSKYRVSSNDFGIFRILVRKGDTLEISGAGYKMQKFMVDDFRDTILYLQPTNELEEVRIKENSIKKELEELQRSYRSKGIYYNGRPPWYLLLPFGGHPLTFFHELLSKDGRHARRFGNYAQMELAFHEVESRFNDYSIKRAVPSIKEDELAEFKKAYRPGIEQIRKWNDYDLIIYIKTSYEKFRQSKSK